MGKAPVTTIPPPFGRFALQIACRATVESFFKPLNAEMVWRRNWQTGREIEVAHFEYINGFYKPRRTHSALGWKSPVAFEQRAAQNEHLTGTEPGQVQFAGSDGDGRTWMTIATFLQTSKMNNVEPVAWLTQGAGAHRQPMAERRNRRPHAMGTSLERSRLPAHDGTRATALSSAAL